MCCVLGADFVERKCAGVACVALSVGYGMGVAVLRSGEVVICHEEWGGSDSCCGYVSPPQAELLSVLGPSECTRPL